MQDCIFCKIINGEMPCYKIYEDDEVLSFLDISKDVEGHILVIPKKHCKNILDCDSETLNYLFEAVKKISNHLVDNCGYDGVNLLNCSDESAGQTVNHFHIHIIPRKKDDNLKVWPELKGSDADLAVVCEKLKLNF